MDYVVKCIEHYQCALCHHKLSGRSWGLLAYFSIGNSVTVVHFRQGQLWKGWHLYSKTQNWLFCGRAGDVNEPLCPECSWQSLHLTCHKSGSLQTYPGFAIYLRRMIKDCGLLL